MGKRKFRVSFEGEAVIELDDAVIRVVNDEWRASFYQLVTPEDIAKHIGYNMIVNNAALDDLDGWADQPEGNAQVLRQPEWEVDARLIQGVSENGSRF